MIVVMNELNLLAPINSLGYGTVALNIFKAAVRAKCKPSLFPLGPVECPPIDMPAVRGAIDNAQYYDPTAPSLRIWHQFDMAQHVGKGKHSGYPFFEVDTLKNSEKHHLAALDVVFASSQWAKEVLINNNIPAERVAVASPGVDTTLFNSTVEKAGLPDIVKPTTTVFLNCGKWELRKSHDMVSRIFNGAFEPTDDVFLIMNCYNPFLSTTQNADWKRFYMNSPMGRAGRVYVMDERLPSQTHVAQLMSAADCGIFPARAEGWGMESAEMLAMGKRVVMTDTTAHRQYAEAAGADIINDSGLTEPAYDGQFFHGFGAWPKFTGEMQVQAIDLVRNIYEDKQAGRLVPNTKGIDAFTNRFTWDNCFSSIKAALT